MEGQLVSLSNLLIFFRCDLGLNTALMLIWGRNEWAGAEPPLSARLEWDELTPREQHAAEQLGYDIESWDEDDTYEQRDAAKSSSWF